MQPLAQRLAVGPAVWSRTGGVCDLSWIDIESPFSMARTPLSVLRFVESLGSMLPADPKRGSLRHPEPPRFPHTTSHRVIPTGPVDPKGSATLGATSAWTASAHETRSRSGSGAQRGNARLLNGGRIESVRDVARQVSFAAHSRSASASIRSSRLYSRNSFMWASAIFPVMIGLFPPPADAPLADPTRARTRRPCRGETVPSRSAASQPRSRCRHVEPLR